MRGSPIERFLAKVKVDPETGCWNWQGTKNKLGYGQFKADGRRVGGRKIGPYRFAWEHHNRQPFPDGLEPDHTCNNRKCCNPAHIEPVTHAENQRRSYARGRKRPGRDYITRAQPSHCPFGHEYTPENTYFHPHGGQSCRECNRRRCLEYQAKKRAKKRLKKAA